LIVQEEIGFPALKGVALIANSLYNFWKRRPPKPPGRSGAIEYFSDPVLGKFKDDFVRTLDAYCYPHGIIDTGRLEDLDSAWEFLQATAKGDLDAFVGTYQEWRVFDETPVYRILIGGIMVTFAVAEDARVGRPVIVALSCGVHEPDGLEAHWRSVVAPRLQAVLLLKL